MTTQAISNRAIADHLQRIAELLSTQDANEFRIRSYRHAAVEVRAADLAIAELAQNDPEKLRKIPGIGGKLAGLIEEFVKTGQSATLDRLEQQTNPVAAIQRLPGIGEELASRVVQDLKISTLEELEQAAHDGRLAQIEGFGEERVQAVRDSLKRILARTPTQTTTKDRRREEHCEADKQRPPVPLLLEIDRIYRERAAAGDLRKIAPKRFNPEGKAWLPIMKTERQGWSFTVLFSNTARAHDLDKTDDWVVIYYAKEDGDKEDQCTVITSQRPSLKGQRVVRGREVECIRYYDKSPADGQLRQ